MIKFLSRDKGLHGLIIFLYFSLLYCYLSFSLPIYAQEAQTELVAAKYEITLKEILDLPTQSLRNFIVTVPNVVRAERLPGDILRVEGIGQGRTFIHVWDAAGRRT